MQSKENSRSRRGLLQGRTQEFFEGGVLKFLKLKKISIKGGVLTPKSPP